MERVSFSFLNNTASWIRWTILAGMLLIALFWPIYARTGHPIWLYVLLLGGYNLLIELLRRFVPGVRDLSWSWVPYLDLPVVAALYYFDAEPSGPLFVGFYIAVATAAIVLPLRHALLYTAATVVAVLAIAPSLPLWAPDEIFLRQFVGRLLMLGLTGVAGAVLVQRLLAEHREAVASGRQAERLEAIDRARADFIASISHDLRTPLTAAQAGIGMAELSLSDRLRPEERELLLNARRNMERLSMLVGDLLAANQLDAGKLELEQEPTDLRSVVTDALSGVHSLIATKGQMVEVDLPEPLPVEGDPKILQHVFINLLGNANRHTPDGTRISVRGRIGRRAHRADSVDSPSGEAEGHEAHEAREAREVREVLVAVSDSGPGIPEADIERIFQPFWRGSSAFGSADRSGSGGSGLGLVIARRLVELHEGRLWVESSPGEGATFCVALPLFTAATTATTTATTTPTTTTTTPFTPTTETQGRTWEPTAEKRGAENIRAEEGGTAAS